MHPEERQRREPTALPASAHPPASPSASNHSYTLIGPDGRPYQDTAKGILGGHRQDRVYGRLTCPAAAQAIAQGGYTAHRVFFASETHAIAAGYRPCAVCLPYTYAFWLRSHRGDQPSPSANQAASADKPPADG